MWYDFGVAWGASRGNRRDAEWQYPVLYAFPQHRTLQP
jgi:hypothetical protein